MFLRLRNVLDRLTGREVAFKGGMSTPGVVRVGDTVRRPMKERSAFVHDVLRHLELRGFDRAPRFLGIDEKGRATLTYIAGTVPQQVGGFRKEQWLAAPRLLRLFHDATVDCELRGECDVICHGDPAPDNYVLRDGMPFALIDFDGAHPGKREEDVGYAAWMWLHIGDHKVAPEVQGSHPCGFRGRVRPSCDLESPRRSSPSPEDDGRPNPERHEVGDHWNVGAGMHGLDVAQSRGHRCWHCQAV